MNRYKVEIRAKKYYVPELELIMVNEHDEIIGHDQIGRRSHAG